jgi:ribosomal protein L2
VWALPSIATLRDVGASGTLIDAPFIAQFQQIRHATKASKAATPGLKVYKPTTPGFRGRIITSREGLWKKGPFKPLTEGFSKTGGRNNQGIITARHRGGGHRKVYRMVDFQRPATAPDGIVERIEYDPNRSARIALIKHINIPYDTPKSQAYSYYLAPEGLVPGAVLKNGPEAPIKPGNTLPLKHIPVGSAIHNIELRPQMGGKLVRAAGTFATLVKKGDDGYSIVKLPSGESRLVLSDCMATLGSLSNALHKNRKLGKAGASRWEGRRPHVRGVAMNSVDHPHGGGRGKSKGGKVSQSPTGVPAKGYRTRDNPRTDRFILVRRQVAKKKRSQ